MIRFFSGLMALVLVVCLAGFTADRVYGDWTVTTTNSMTIAQTADLVNPQSGRSLSFTCADDELAMFVYQSNYFIGDGGDALFRIRFDDDGETRSMTVWGGLSPDRRFAMIMMNGLTNLRRRIQSRERVTVEAIDPYDDERVTMRFSLRGARQALQQLSCF